MFEFLFLDLDDTILDFQKAEHIALSKTLQSFGLDPTEEVLKRYNKINRAHWEALERKEMTRDQVLEGRFADETMQQQELLPRLARIEEGEIIYHSEEKGDIDLSKLPRNGKQMREASAYAMTFPCGYSLNYLGYMPSNTAVPHGGYEVFMCRYVPGTGESVVLALLEKFQDMKNA